jgi:Holliday junction resolvase RusA-like endonuclease
MKSLSFQVPQRAKSLNNSHQSFVGRSSSGKLRVFRNKKTTTRSYEDEFRAHIAEYADLFADFVSTFDDRKHAIKIEAYFYFNEKEFFAKPKKKSDTKRISKSCADLDNILKLNFDLIFEALKINDASIVNIEAWKVPTNDAGTMVFRLTHVPFPEMFVVPLGEFVNSSLSL